MLFSRGWVPEKTMPPESDLEQWLKYKSKGGTVAFDSWLKAGKPMVTRTEMAAWLKKAEPVSGPTADGETPAEPVSVKEIIPGELWLYDDGTYRDVFGIVVGKTPEEARDWAEKKALGPQGTTDKEMSDYEKALVALQGQKAGTDWAAQSASDILARERFAWEKEQAGLAKFQERAAMELQFEKDRNQLLRGLPSDDWVKRYIIQNQPNPYKEQKVSPVDKLEAELDLQTANVQALQRNLVQASLAKNWDLADKIRDELTYTARARDTTYKDWNAMKQENINWSPQVPQPYPNAPGWLPQYAPGTIAGQMITKQRTVTPSGQQLTQMSPSQTGQLGAYADWAADYTGERQWRDILGEAHLMQPKTPFSGTRWSPAGARI